MPPKKKEEKKSAVGQAVDEDISDAASLPLLNDFIFVTMYAFKYRRNKHLLEKALYQEFFVSLEGETAEIAKRNRVIQMQDLLTQAKAKGYLTEDEASNLDNVDESKVRQALAKCTNELVAAIQMPLRRLKAEQERQFQEELAKVPNEQDREAQSLARFQKTSKDLELTLWLKDFPKTALDFQELRRSGAQYQPDIEVAIHGAFMIEEMFKRDADLDEEAFKIGDAKEVDAEEVKRQSKMFKKEDRVSAFKDLAFINKFARNCPQSSQLRLMTAVKLPIVAMDPPLDLPDKPDQEQEVVQSKPEDKTKKGKQEEIVQPVEIVKSPEEIAELKPILEFVKFFRDQVTSAENDITEYRALSHPVFGAKKVPLWTRKVSKEEQEKARLQKEAEEREKKAKEEAEAEARRQEEEAQKKAGSKGKPAPAKPDPKAAQAASKPDLRPQSQSEGPKTTEHNITSTPKLAEPEFSSMDDRKVDWNFQSFKKIVEKMDSSKTTVGSMMAAMVYQIEKNSTHPSNSEALKAVVSSVTIEKDPSVRGTIGHTITDDSVNTLSVNSLVVNPREQFMSELDDMLKKLAVEHGTAENDFQHVFAESKVNNTLKDSPYQVLHNEQDTIAQITKAFTFLNGRTPSDYEASCLKTIRLPGVNNRFKMPTKATRQKAEREADTAAILKFCPLEPHMTKRLICLRHFEDLLQSENPERSYEFTHRNCTEELDAETFRQVLTQCMRLNPDINTSYFDKEDALLLAVNFKNPPGRLLRRQWTYPVKTFVEMPDFRKLRQEQLELKSSLIDIAATRAGILRTNSKFCFPCDNSVIRVDKSYVGGRRFGSCTVLKDNLIFGITESRGFVQDKVFGQDELINMETRRSEQRNGELWIEFENKARMLIQMNESAEIDEVAIPSVATSQKMTSGRGKIALEDQSQASLPQTQHDPLSSPRSPVRRETNQSPTRNFEAYTSRNSVNLMTNSQEVGKSMASKSLFKSPEKARPASDSDYDPLRGASITFTFNEGLVVNIRQNGDIEQTNLQCQRDPYKKSSVLQEEMSTDCQEVSRVVTRSAVIIKTQKDGNKVIYFPDGTITRTDLKQGIWVTTNPKGVVRERNLKLNSVQDNRHRLTTVTKIDPETSAVVEIREDGLLKITYVDRRTLLIFPDNTHVLVTKSGPQEEGSAVTTTLIKKENYSPVRIISDPVKARANTVIGLGGTDSLMGKDNIMERSNGGVISEVLLPDRTVFQTYFEKQELPGYNKFSQSLIHLVKRDDFSIIKVRQDGEVVIITANERAYLNDIGKQEDFGKTDFDYFFELFGVPRERRSGVYTCNLEQGRMWTQDEEGNFFMLYANGDSAEKLSVSFNLDQMTEGIDNKEPSSPRVCEGEYIEEECKFLPPPKSVAEPRLFLVTSKGATEYLSETQLEYLFRTNTKDATIIKSQKQISVDNESATSHRFTRMQTSFVPDQPLTLAKDAIPKVPQCLDMVNQTVTIPQEPPASTFTWRNIVQYKVPTGQQVESFNQALKMKQDMRTGQAQTSKKLKIEPRVLPEDRNATQNAIWLRIARTRGINVQGLLAEEYNQVKVIDRDEKRQKVFDSLDDFFSPNKADADTVSDE